MQSLTGLAVEDQSPSDEDGKRGCEWTRGLKHLVVELGVTSEPLFKDEADGYDDAAQLATARVARRSTVGTRPPPPRAAARRQLEGGEQAGEAVDVG